MFLKIYTDGGSFGNPGPSGIGAVFINEEDLIIKKISKYIGNATNNQAEYKAVLFALEEAKKIKASKIEFFLDSELVVKQLNREYKIKNKGLAPLFIKVWNLIQSFKKVSFIHIPREKNKEADNLVKKVISEALKK